jgi:hypothetical protein
LLDPLACPVHILVGEIEHRHQLERTRVIRLEIEDRLARGLGIAMAPVGEEGFREEELRRRVLRIGAEELAERAARELRLVLLEEETREPKARRRVPSINAERALEGVLRLLELAAPARAPGCRRDLIGRGDHALAR